MPNMVAAREGIDTMSNVDRNRYMIGLIGVSVAVVALLVLPFVGFTEKTLYWWSPEITGLGTWVDGLAFLAYPTTLSNVSVVLMIGAVVLLVPLRLLWHAYRQQVEPAVDRLQLAAAISAGVSVGSGVMLLLSMYVLLPSVEEQTIWLVNEEGFLGGWWPSYGAFVAIGGAGIAWWAMWSRLNSPDRDPPPPPPPPE